MEREGARQVPAEGAPPQGAPRGCCKFIAKRGQGVLKTHFFMGVLAPSYGETPVDSTNFWGDDRQAGALLGALLGVLVL